MCTESQSNYKFPEIPEFLKPYVEKAHKLRKEGEFEKSRESIRTSSTYGIQKGYKE